MKSKHCTRVVEHRFLSTDEKQKHSYQFFIIYHDLWPLCLSSKPPDKIYRLHNQLTSKSFQLVHFTITQNSIRIYARTNLSIVSILFLEKKETEKKKKRERENESNEIKSLRMIKENEMKRIFKIIVLLIIAKILSKDFIPLSLSLSCFVTRLSFRVSGARRPSPPLSRHAFSDPRILIGPDKPGSTFKPRVIPRLIEL